jgi:hypothetical protein
MLRGSDPVARLSPNGGRGNLTVKGIGMDKQTSESLRDFVVQYPLYAIVDEWLRPVAWTAVVTALGWFVSWWRQLRWQREFRGAAIGFVSLVVALALIGKAPQGVSPTPTVTRSATISAPGTVSGSISTQAPPATLSSNWKAGLAGAVIVVLVLLITSFVRRPNPLTEPNRPLITIQSPSGDSVPTWKVVRGFAYPSPSLVQVLIEAGPPNDRRWYPQADAKITRYEWMVRSRFGDDNSQTGWGFRFCAVVPKTRISGTVKEIPADAIVSEIISVSLNRNLPDENL